MLVLTRSVGQEIRIGNDIVVVLLSMNGTQTRIGIAAPQDISIHREEIYQKILLESEPSDR